MTNETGAAPTGTNSLDLLERREEEFEEKIRQRAKSSRTRPSGYQNDDYVPNRRMNSKPQRELEGTLREDGVMDFTAGYGQFSSYNLPPEVVDRFRDQGFLLGNFTYENFKYNSEVVQMATSGWIPVELSEIPELASFLVPFSKFLPEEHRQYFIYRDHLLMKISIENYDRWIYPQVRIIENDLAHTDKAVHRSSRLLSGGSDPREEEFL